MKSNKEQESGSSEYIIDQYKIEADNISSSVKITGRGKKALNYHLAIPECSEATLALLDKIKYKLITEVSVSTAEILDPRIMSDLKKRFEEKSREFLLKELKNIDVSTQNFFTGILMQEMLGLGKIEFLLNDVNLEEIVVNCPTEPVKVYHRLYGWLDTNIFIKTEEEIQNYASIIARRVGRQITTLEPLLDAHLISGDRANAILYPISTKGNTLTLRKFARDPWTVVDLIQNKTISSELAALLWLAIQYEMNIIISGGTASGKTSLLNVMMPFIPANQRIVTIEQTRELQLPAHLFWCPLVVRLPNPEGKGEVNMLDLLINSLRMRPDRIILGEIRTAEEASVLFEAMHTGHAVYATLHADSLSETISRLTNPPISVPANMLNAVNLCVTMFRDRRKGIRRTYQVGEFVASEEATAMTIKPNILYRWKPSTDEIVAHAKSYKFFDDLSRHTNLTMNEINEDLADKKKLLEMMAKKKIRHIDNIGRIIKEYYLDPKSALKIIQDFKEK